MRVRKRIGLMVPSTNTTCEPDFYRTVPPEITVHAQRMWLTNDGEGAASVDRMNEDTKRGAEYLKTAQVDVVVYGCTTGSFYKGPAYDAELLEMISETAGVPAVGMSPAVAEALRSLGAQRISVATPYPDWINDQLRAYYETLGFEVLNVDGDPTVAGSGHQVANDQAPETVLEFAASVCLPEADALFCSCAAWRTMEIVEELEERIGRPVVASNQAAIWATLKELGVTSPATGLGTLFAQTVQ